MAHQPTPAEVFAGLRDRLLAQHPEDTEGRMLQSPGLRAGGKFYAFVGGSDVVMKLPADRVAALIAAGDGQPCSPRPGHPMREWIQVPALDEDTCLALVTEARAFVVSQLLPRPGG